MFERITDRMRIAIALANRQANELGHDVLTPAHIVLGLLAEGTGQAAKLLHQAGVTLDAARAQCARSKPAADRSGSSHDRLPQAESFKQAILSAIAVARERGQHWIGTEHLLIGLLRDPASDSLPVLAALGVNIDALRRQTDEILRERPDSQFSQVGIVGVSGYGGGEVLRLCAGHPRFQVVYVAGEGSAGQKLIDRFPGIGQIGQLTIQKWDAKNLPKLDLLFSSLPSGESKAALAAIPQSTKIVDVGGDHRFADGWTYGLADIWPDKIAASGRVANPGCYAAATIAALAPLIAEKLIDPASIMVDGKSGVSGAGRGGGTTLGYADVNEDVSAYGFFNHAQVNEMTQALSAIHGSSIPPLLFTPHLIPMTRGILSTCYASGSATTPECLAAARRFYEGKPFVRVVDQPPHTKWATGSNLVFVSYAADPARKKIVALGAIDNLGKGAAGQAVQNANLMMGIDERTGLEGAPLWP